jgi:hypothetical protein
MTTTEKNKMIALFIGDEYDVEGRLTFLYTIGEEFPYSNRVCKMELIDDEIHQELDEFGSNLDSSTFSYHNSWDWLMPVVEKCYNLEDYPETNLVGDITFALVDVNIEEVYNAVVKFIVWYNQNK